VDRVSNSRGCLGAVLHADSPPDQRSCP
jgi:hypothetical protein